MSNEHNLADESLQQELYKDLLNTIPAGAYRLRAKLCDGWRVDTWRSMMDAKYSVDLASDRFCEILGIANDAFVANPGIVPDLIHPDDKEDFNARNALAMTDCNPFLWEGRIISNGQTKWVHFESVPRIADPETVLWTGIVYDISERKQAEEALRDREEQLRVIFDTSQAGIIMVGPQGTILFANDRMAEMFGMSLGQMLGSHYSEHLHPAERQVGDERMRQLILGEIQMVTSERHYLRADGSDFWGYLSGKRLENPDGTLRALVGIIADITERKRAEEALKESEFFFKESQRSASIGSYKADLIAGQWESSEVLNDIFGIDKNYNRSIQGWLEIVHAEDRDMLGRYLKDEVIAQRKPFAKEYRIVRRNDGEIRWVSGLGEVKFDSDGNVLLLMGTIHDITEQKRRDEENAKLETQLQQAQKMESLGRLAGGVAHDFNNMLSVILGHAQLALKKDAVTPRLREHLEQIQKAAERSADIVRQLLAFARRQTVAPKLLDLNETVASMLKMLRRLIGEDIDLVWLPDEGLWSVKMDPAQLDQILANLCVNARDAIAGVGKVTIETGNITFDDVFCAGHRGFVPGEYILLTVSDDGSGMDKEALTKIFEPFYTTKEVGKGTGLGLATVYGIVNQNNGFITVYSEPGQGTSFKIYLPRYLGKEEQVRAAGSVEPVRRGEETVLVVEDEPAILELGKEMLEMQGYRVLAASTPGEALRLAEEHIGEIHLLLTDVVMPEMNGREMARKLLSLYPGLKRLFMSGYTADVIAHHGVLDEGVQFIQKPFSFDALVAKVREALDH